MKKNNLFSFATIWVTLAIATLISSCSSNKSKLLESVPFDADIIGTLNLIELASNSGVKIENSQIVLPAEYTQLKESIPADMLKMGAQWAEAVDLESVVIFGYMKSNDFYGTALIKDADKVRQLLEDNDFTSEMKNGVEIYAKGSNCFAFDDSSDQLWILEKRRVDKLEEFALARKKNNITRYSGLAEALTDDNIANWVFDQTSLGTGLDGQWCVFGVNVKNNAIVAEGKLISTDGEVYINFPVGRDELALGHNGIVFHIHSEHTPLAVKAGAERSLIKYPIGNIIVGERFGQPGISGDVVFLACQREFFQFVHTALFKNPKLVRGVVKCETIATLGVDFHTVLHLGCEIVVLQQLAHFVGILDERGAIEIIALHVSENHHGFQIHSLGPLCAHLEHVGGD